jgi:Xaa-Pro aminopeptidase
LPSISEMGLEVGVTVTRPYNGIEQTIKLALALGRKVHILPPYRPENKIKLSEWFGVPILGLAELVSVTLIEAIVNQRSYKEAREVVEMHQATLTSGKMHLAAMRYAKPGMKVEAVRAECFETV